MSKKLDFRALLLSLFIAGLVTFILCIAGDLIFDWTMYQLWMLLMPGFTWPLTPSGIIFALIWLIAYSVYFAAIIVYPYNLFVERKST
jgi:hypothetical protein